jgi:hypothetical protein
MGAAVLVGDGGSVYLPEDGDVEVNLQMLDVETRLALLQLVPAVSWW